MIYGRSVPGNFLRGGCVRKEDIRLNGTGRNACRGDSCGRPLRAGARPAPTQYDHMIRAFEKELIINHLVKNNWHRIKTAKELGISRNRLYKKMQALGIDG